jgi:hypothetical protein
MSEFEIYENQKLDEYCFDIINDTSVENLKKLCKNNKNCVGFDSEGRLFFHVPEDKFEKQDGIDIYIHKERHQEIISKQQDKYGEIPKIIHFIWFKGGRAFNLIHYLAVKAALHHCQDYQINIHCDAEPEDNFYFEDLKQRENVSIQYFNEITELNGHYIQHFQHRCDYIRLNVLYEYGGIYLDIDNIILRPLDDFLNRRLVMGYEREFHTTFITNSVIMVEKNNPMIEEWIDIYKSSWGKDFIAYWNGHSIRIPYQLSHKYGYMMDIQDHTTFFPFLWDDTSILNKNYDNGKNYENSYVIALWETELSKTDLLPQTPFYFKTYKNAFTRLFGYLVDDLIINENDEFIIIDGFDMLNCDTGCAGRISPEELKEKCKENMDAVAINSLGFFKYAVGLNHLVSFAGRSYCNSQDKLYIIKDRCGQKFW